VELFRHLLVAACASLAVATATAGEVQVAVAANFTAPMRKIAAAFNADTGHHARLSFGSTGLFYAQIRSGAPFQVLLAADDETPAKLARQGFATADSRITYATGRLVLWSATPTLVDDQGAVLEKRDLGRIALANPKLSPYGAAAIETLTRLGALQRLQPHFVQGENIGQAFQFVSTGNAALGFVALSQVMQDGRLSRGSAWIVPSNLHAPLRQDAIQLTKGRNNPAASALVEYLRGEKSRAIIRSFGYET
jgi:molybdate transport system substrate-binding protein